MILKKIYDYLYFKAYMWSFTGSFPELAPLGAAILLSIPAFIYIFSFLVFINSILDIIEIGGTLDFFFPIIVMFAVIWAHLVYYVKNKYYSILYDKFKLKEPVDKLLGSLFLLIYYVGSVIIGVNIMKNI